MSRETHGGRLQAGAARAQKTSFGAPFFFPCACAMALAPVSIPSPQSHQPPTPPRGAVTEEPRISPLSLQQRAAAHHVAHELPLVFVVRRGGLLARALGRVVPMKTSPRRLWLALGPNGLARPQSIGASGVGDAVKIRVEAESEEVVVIKQKEIQVPHPFSASSLWPDFFAHHGKKPRARWHDSLVLRASTLR